MTYREARCAFSYALAELVMYAKTLPDHEVALDEVTERITSADPTSDHMKDSLHHLGLAGDILLYVKGVYQRDTEVYRQLGEWWIAYGIKHGLPLRWGGNFRKPDGNHFSLQWGGRS